MLENAGGSTLGGPPLRCGGGVNWGGRVSEPSPQNVGSCGVLSIADWLRLKYWFLIGRKPPQKPTPSVAHPRSEILALNYQPSR